MIVLKSFLISLITSLLLVTYSVAQPKASYSLYTGGTNVAVTREAGSGSLGGCNDNTAISYYFESVSNSHLKYIPSNANVYGNISLTANVTPGTYQIRYMKEEITEDYDCMTSTYKSLMKLITVTVEGFSFTSTPPSSVNHFCGRVDFGTYLPLSGITWTVVTANGGSFQGNVYTTGTATGSVTVKGTKLYDNGTASITHTFTMANPVTVTTSNSTPEVGEEVVFTSSISAAVDYMWDFGDGGTMINSTGYHYYYSPGQKTIKLTMTAATDPTCTRTYAFANKVNVKTVDIVTNLDEDNIGEIAVYPIPFDDYLTFKVNTDLIADIQITTMQGNRVLLFKEYKLSTGENKIPMVLDPGIYIVEVINKNQQSRKFKTIKK